MIRGVSEVFRFALPCQCEDLKSIKFVCGQTNNSGPSASRPLPIVKVLSQCQMEQNPPCISIQLNQEETLRFSDKRKAYVQLRGETNSGTPIVCRKQYVTVYPVVDDAVLDSSVILPTPVQGENWVFLDGGSILSSGQADEALVQLDAGTIE